jgi:uncharacterized membrane-anchored protein
LETGKPGTWKYIKNPPARAMSKAKVDETKGAINRKRVLLIVTNALNHLRSLRSFAAKKSFV